MCGRFTLTVEADVLRDAFNLTTMPEILPARFNIAPSQPVAVITNEDSQALNLYRWGLVPSWAKDLKFGNKLINARGETVHEKPSFRSAFKRRRCLVPADGFFEWHQCDGDKVPMYIHLNDRSVFAMAGLWEIWYSPEGDEVRSCTIITTTANEFMSQFHHRMPVILHKEDYALWLSPDEEPQPVLQALIRPHEADVFSAYAVSKIVNKPANDLPECIEPVA